MKIIAGKIIACLVAAIGLGSLNLGCNNEIPPLLNPTWVIPNLDWKMPGHTQWQISDKIAAPSDAVKGGTLLRLELQDQVPGSPKINIVYEPLRIKPTKLANFSERQNSAFQQQLRRNQLKATERESNIKNNKYK